MNVQETPGSRPKSAERALVIAGSIDGGVSSSVSGLVFREITATIEDLEAGVFTIDEFLVALADLDLKHLPDFAENLNALLLALCWDIDSGFSPDKWSFFSKKAKQRLPRFWFWLIAKFDSELEAMKQGFVQLHGHDGDTYDMTLAKLSFSPLEE